LREELEIHVENVKKEAMDSFDQQRYQESVGMFQFLCELEPHNRKLQDYLELSRQFVREAEAAREQTGQSLVPGLAQETNPGNLLTRETVAGQSGGATAEPTQIEEVGAQNCKPHAARDDGRPNRPAVALPPVKGSEGAQVLSSNSLGRSGEETARDGEVEIRPTGSSRRKKLWAVILLSAAVLLLATAKGWLLHRRQGLALSPAVYSDLDQAPAPKGPKGEVDERETSSGAPPLSKPNPEGVPNPRHGSGPDSKNTLEGRGSELPPVENTALPTRQRALSYPVIHDHVLGSCTGSLRLDSKSIAFLPAADSKDGFNFRLADITGTELGDKLKIRFNNKIYRFKAGSARNKEDNRSRLNAIYQQLARLRAGPL
jgi:hypothetical protein